MFTRALLLLACCLPVLYAGWPRPSLLGVSFAVGTGIREQERRVLNMDPDSLESWTGMRVILLGESGLDGPVLHDRCFRKTCLLEFGRLAGVDQVWHASLEQVADRWLLSWRWFPIHDAGREEVVVRTLPAGDTVALHAAIREWFQNRK